MSSPRKMKQATIMLPKKAIEGNSTLPTPTPSPMSRPLCTPSNAATTHWRTVVCPHAPDKYPRGFFRKNDDVPSDFSETSSGDPKTPANLVPPANLWPSPAGTPTAAATPSARTFGFGFGIADAEAYCRVAGYGPASLAHPPAVADSFGALSAVIGSAAFPEPRQPQCMLAPQPQSHPVTVTRSVSEPAAFLEEQPALKRLHSPTSKDDTHLDVSMEAAEDLATPSPDNFKREERMALSPLLLQSQGPITPERTLSANTVLRAHLQSCEARMAEAFDKPMGASRANPFGLN